MSKKTFKPSQFNVVSSADEIGAITDFSRIPGESLASYKTRFLEDSRRPANSTYEGLINAINRNLGLERVEAIEVTLKIKSFFPAKHSDISILQDVLTDNRHYSFVTSPEIRINANKVQFNVDTFIDKELIGMSLFINGEEFTVISNTINEIIFDGNLSGINDGINFELYQNWIQDSLVGLSIQSESNNFVIISNNNNTLRVDSRKFESLINQELTIVANRPRLHITSSRLFLYKDFVHDKNFQLDKVINLKDNGLTQRDIVKEINSSNFFTATDLMPHSVDVYARTFKQQDSDNYIYNELVPVSKYFKLKHENIKEGSIKFSQEDIFFKETRNLDDVTYGPYYYLNHRKGIVHSKKIPTKADGRVSYIYKQFPFRIESSPVIITSFADEDAQKFLFIQTEKRTYDDVREKYMSTQPKSDMVEYVAELLSESKELWGE